MATSPATTRRAAAAPRRCRARARIPDPVDSGGGDDDPGTDDPGTDDPGTDDPGGDDGPRLEGGGGCAAATGASMALPLLALLVLGRRRRPAP